MPGRGHTADDVATVKTSVRKHPQTTDAQLKRSPYSLAWKARASKVARKLDGQSRDRPPLSSGIDPGPSGFDWKELEP
jgi:hypothetical protein